MKVLIRNFLALSVLCLGAVLVGSTALAQEAHGAKYVFEGTVHSPDGTAAVGVVVVSSAGSKAVTDDRGSYRLEAHALPGVRELRVTAVGGAGGKLVSSVAVSIASTPGVVSVPSMQLAVSSSCSLSWLPTFGGASGVDEIILALVAFDDGSGPALYAGGLFSTAGSVAANRIAKWDGVNWSALGSGLNNHITCLTVFDDGGGDALYAGGNFSVAGGVPARGIAKWDGTAWSALANGVPGSVDAMVVFDDGNGDALYAGIGTAGLGGLPVPAFRVVTKWDGSSWSALGAGLAGYVNALAVYDDGNGECLYAGGIFAVAGSVSANNIAKWDGSTWSALGSGLNNYPLALTVFDDGTGEKLVVGGAFSTAGGISANRVATWNGSTWAAIGSGLNEGVGALAVFDSGSGPELYAGGNFNVPGGAPGNGIVRLVGSAWMPLGAGVSLSVRAIAEFDDGNGPLLFLGGDIGMAGGQSANDIAAWDGVNWVSLEKGLSAHVNSLAVFDDGTGSALFAAGSFDVAGGEVLNRIGKWNGSSWAPLGSGLAGGFPQTFAVFDDGTGDALYVAGGFTTAGGLPASSIAKWDGANWTTLGAGTGGTVLALAVFDDGTGEKLYAGGTFNTTAGGIADYIAAWDGSLWTILGQGPNGYVSALTVFDDGSGPELYVAGAFSSVSFVPASAIAKWDGTTWAALGSGLDGAALSLQTFDDGSGARLIAGGRFSAAGGMPAKKIASWDGANWSELGGGITAGSSDGIFALELFDDGTGAALYATGEFWAAGGVSARGIARWDGANWSPLGAGLFNRGLDLAVYDDGGGDALYVGGPFALALDSGDRYLAKWGCETATYNELCNGDGGDGLGCTDCPCTNNAMPGTIGGCLNSALTSARLIVSGNASVSLPSGAANDLRFSLTGAPAGAFAILNSGDALAPTGMANPCFGLGSGVQAMQFDGLRCAVVNTRRHGGRSADSNGDIGVTNSPWGGEGGPPVGIAQQGAGFVAGQTRYFQVINRDDPLAQCMRGLNTSQAVEIVFEP